HAPLPSLFGGHHPIPLSHWRPPAPGPAPLYKACGGLIAVQCAEGGWRDGPAGAPAASPAMSSGAGPAARLCRLERGPDGYGFHLHGEKGKPGQFIRLVEAGSPAERSGLRAGDRLLEVNGENVERESHQQVVERIRAAAGTVSLLVVDSTAEDQLPKRDGANAEPPVVSEQAAPVPAEPPAREPSGGEQRQLLPFVLILGIVYSHHCLGFLPGGRCCHTL
ncbi:Na(+)/H(+) exchange regulatory cofactor NHE-RF1, partial [Lamprotornis superbus]